MDWLNKIKANLNLKKNIMTFEWNNQKGQANIKFIYGQGYDSPESDESDDSGASTDESSTEDELEIEEQYLEKWPFLMWQDDWQTRPNRLTKTVTFKDDETIQIITNKEWIPVENNIRTLEQIDHHSISDEIARSISQLQDIQCYQEGVKIQ